MIEATRRDFEKRISGITAEVAKKEEELAKQRDSLAEAEQSFFSSLKTKRIDRQVCRSRAGAKADVFDYIERF